MSTAESGNLNKTRFPALRSRDFRLFWIGQFLSLTGSNLQSTALNWHLYQLSGSALALGMLGLIRFVPIVLLSLVGGSLADALNRRHLMLVTQSVLMINAAILGWLTFRGQISVAAIYILTAINAGAMAFDNPARQSLIPNLVPREHLVNAVSLNSTLFKVATIIGPMAAGMLIGEGGIGLTYWLNAASFIAVLAALIAMHTDGNKDEHTPVSIAALREGLLFVRNTPIILGMMILDCLATFFSSANALLPVFAKDILHVGARGYGMLSAAPAVGSLVAASAISLLPNIRRQGRVVLVAVFFHGLATLCFGLSRAFLLSCLFLALANGADTLSTIMRQSIRQLATPDRLRGRVSAVNMVFFMGGPRLGELEAGMVANWLGAPFSVATGGIGCILTVLILGSMMPTLRDYTLKER